MSVAFGFVWGLLLLPLPLAMRWLPPARIDRDALWVPFFAGLDAVQASGNESPRPRRQLVLAWLLLIGALAQPAIVTHTTNVELFRPLLLGALILAVSASRSLTRRLKPLRRLPERYHRGERR